MPTFFSQLLNKRNRPCHENFLKFAKTGKMKTVTTDWWGINIASVFNKLCQSISLNTANFSQHFTFSTFHLYNTVCFQQPILVLWIHPDGGSANTPNLSIGDHDPLHYLSSNIAMKHNLPLAPGLSTGSSVSRVSIASWASGDNASSPSGHGISVKKKYK